MEQQEPQFGQADVTVLEDRWHLRLAGEISLEMRPRLDEVLEQVATEERAVDVDLGGVTFLDSSGIGFLSRLGIENPSRVRVLHATGLTRELLDLTGMRRLLTIDTV